MPHADARLNVFARTLIVTRVAGRLAPGPPATAVRDARSRVDRVDPLRAAARVAAAGCWSTSGPPRSGTGRVGRAGALVVERSPDGLAEATGVPARTTSRVLARDGIPRLTGCDPITGEVIRASRTTAVRYERAAPGELVHMDVEKLGRIPDGGGWRVHGRAAAQAAEHQNPVGHDDVHSLIDDRSRLAYSEVLTDEKGVTCAGFPTRAAASFADHAITRIQRVATDNAWAHQHSVKGVCAQLGARQKFIRPHHPWQNGKVERLNRTLATEWAYRRPCTSNDQ